MTKSRVKVSKPKAEPRRRARRTAGNANIAGELRQRVFSELPAATWSLVQQIEQNASFADILAHFASHPEAGVDSRGAAAAMQRACAEAGLRSWCYEFGDPRSFTHMVLLVEEDGKIHLHDPYLDLSGKTDLLAMLDQLDSGQVPEFAAGELRRSYVADTKLEDQQSRNWLALAEDAGRGARVEVSGGLPLLENTSPAYRAMLEAADLSSLGQLLLRPVALLSPDGVPDDMRHLADRLGLIAANPREVKGARAQKTKPVLFSRDEEPYELVRQAQQQMALVLDQLNTDRAAQAQELAELRESRSGLQVELATLRETTKAELMRAAQARMVADQARTSAEQDVQQTNARLNQMKAEIDDAHAEARRIQDLLNISEGETRRLLEALDASEAERQRLEAPLLEAEVLTATFGGESARSLLASMSVGSAASVRPDGALAVHGRRSGCVAYGPYLNLAAGSYRLELDFAQKAFAALLLSRVTVEVVDGHRYLHSHKFKLTGGRSNLALEFDVPPAQQAREVEFRIVVGHNSYATLRDLRLIALGRG